MKLRTICAAGLWAACAAANAQDSFQGWYVGADFGNASVKMRSGGFNTLGPHRNTGAGSDHAPLMGARAGIERGAWRFDLSYAVRDGLQVRTNSFMPPTPTFFYKTSVDSETLMASVHYRFFQSGGVGLYGGLGAGVSRLHLATNDTVVSGSRSESNGVWQGELGVEYALAPSFVIATGYRYVNLGRVGISLSDLALGAPAGSLTGRITSREWFGSVRLRF